MLILHPLYLLPVMLVICSQHTHISALQFQDIDKDSSYFKDSPCPNAEDIAPCQCITVLGEPLEIRCIEIADEQQLHDIFHGSFPVKQFDILYLETYYIDTLSDDVFGEVMFKGVRTPDYGNGLLTSVGPETFMNMSLELSVLSLDYNLLSTFPFETIPLYPKLLLLSLRENPLSSFPIIQSESLRLLDVSHGMYDNLPEGALDGVPNLEYLYVSSYKPLSIAKGVFSSLHTLKRIEIVMSEGLNHISSFEFEVNSTELATIYLRYNDISTVDIDAFKGIQASTSNPEGTTIDMTGNSLTSLPEATWRPIFDVGVKLDLSGNGVDSAVECGCDISWLVLEPSYHPLVNLWCNGVNLADLDPSWYEDNC